MLDLLFMLIIAVIIVILLFVAIDYFSGALKTGDNRLWLLLKGLIVLAAVVYVLHRQGVV